MKLFLVIGLSLFLFSCNNSAGDDVVKEFDSVNQSLQKIDMNVSSSAKELYRQLESKLSADGKGESLRQFQYRVNDFYGYMADLEQRFYKACGDTTGTGAGLTAEGEDAIDITNKFFAEKGLADQLPLQLQEVQAVLLKQTNDPALQVQIRKLTSYPGEERKTGFNKGWFYNAPPVAALTMLNKFENDVRRFELQVLKELAGN